MAAPLVIVGRLFAGIGRRASQAALTRSIKNMFKGTSVDGDIDIQSHTSAKVVAKGKPIEFPNPLFSDKFWNDLGANLVNQYRHYIFDKTNPRDAYGKPFKQPYSKGYEKSKKTGNMFRQDSSYSNSYAPYLTGDLYRDLDHSVDAKKNTIYIGWNAEANKIDWLKKNGRILTDARYPLPKDVVDKAMKIMNNELKKTMPKGTHHIKVTAKVHATVSPKAKK
tara:strand:- start:2662 stop:3327 length:666 start_codon:yes stop_codon:yes gene_type:complete